VLDHREVLELLAALEDKVEDFLAVLLQNLEVMVLLVEVVALVVRLVTLAELVVTAVQA
jgi:hypothetical protein